MSTPAVFFDRDNTLIVNDVYLGDPDGVVLADGAAAAISKARALGFRVVTVSNQGGVAKGVVTEADVRKVNARMDELLVRDDPMALIDLHLFCPFHPEGVVERYRIESDLRKPLPGMLFQAARELDLDLKRSWMIGDSARDMEAGAAAGCRTILVNLPDVRPSPAASTRSAVAPEATVSGLIAAIGFIEAEIKKARD